MRSSPALPCRRARVPRPPGRRPEMVPVVEVAQRRLAGIDPEMDRTAAAAIAAVGTAARHVGLLPEGRGPVAAIAGADPDLHAVEEHRGHSRTLRAASRSGPRRRSDEAGYRYPSGLTRWPPSQTGPRQTSKWRCGPVALPDWPTRPTRCRGRRAGRARPRSPTCGCTSCTARSRARPRPGSRRRCSSSRRR